MVPPAERRLRQFSAFAFTSWLRAEMLFRRLTPLPVLWPMLGETVKLVCNSSRSGSSSAAWASISSRPSVFFYGNIFYLLRGGFHVGTVLTRRAAVVNIF